MWEFVVVATELRKKCRDLGWVLEGKRAEHSPDSSEIDRRKEVLNIDPQDPLSVALGGEIGDGFVVGPSGISLTPVVEAPKAAGQRLGDKVIYPNAHTDGDWIAAPTVSGLATYAQLRSAESPERLRIRVGGAVSVRPGGPEALAPAAELVRDGSVVALLTPPMALDSEGTRVPVSWRLDGRDLVVDVDHRERDLAYPVLVDPDVVYTNQRTNWTPGWDWWQRDPEGHGSRFCHGSNGAWFRGPGLYTYRREDGPGQNCKLFNDWEWGEYNWQARGRSKIVQARSQNFFDPDMHTPDPDSCGYAGIYSVRNQAWEHAGPNLWQCYFTGWGGDAETNSTGSTEGNKYVTGTQILGPGWQTRYWFTRHVSAAALTVVDDYEPVVQGSPPTGWLRGGTFPITFSDPDLGVRRTDFTPDVGADEQEIPCSLEPGSRCPEQVTRDVQVDALPEGRVNLNARAWDLGGRTAERSWEVKVDRTGPELEVAGPVRELTMVDGEVLDNDFYDLWIDATDGDESMPRAGVASIEILVDGQRQVLYEGDEVCEGDSCPLDYHWELSPYDFSPGEHVIEVRAADKAGNPAPPQRWTVMVARSEDADAEEQPLEDGQENARDAGTTTAPPSVPRQGSGAGCQAFQPEVGIGRDDRLELIVTNDRETTIFFAGGTYRVTRCDSFGRLLLSQLVGDVPVPNGAVARLPLQTASGGGSNAITVATPEYPDDPDAPDFAADWAEFGLAAQGDVIPPTVAP